MELQVYQALIAAGAPEEAAKNAAESINRAIDSRYAIHAKELATRGDIEQIRADLEKTKGELRTEIARIEANLIKWLVGTGLVIIGVILKTMH
ncbi:hypothetical protein AGMMS50289_10390 [Betaproteobacteria bacterium]|nr:hypothetical protein AGMMS50289_10390 [Betaproteobacteria bacterium]